MTARAITSLDSRMFGRDWWALPLRARHASVEAVRVGLTVSVEMVKHPDYYKPYPCIVWSGTTEQFTATTVFSDGILAKRSSGRWVARGQLRGCVYPDGVDRFRFVIKGCYIDGKRDIKFLAAKALADDSYQNFRHALMTGDPVTREEFE